MKYKVVWTKGASKRTQPTVYGTNIGTFNVGTILEVQEDEIPDKTSPEDEGKAWVFLGDGYVASRYPDSSGDSKVRLEKIDDNPISELPEYITLELPNGERSRYDRVLP